MSDRPFKSTKARTTYDGLHDDNDRLRSALEQIRLLAGNSIPTPAVATEIVELATAALDKEQAPG